MESRATFHIQNIFDALNPHGTGVSGHLKLKCLQLENRVISLASSGDIVVINEDCPLEFIEYVLRITGTKDVLLLPHQVSRDLRKYLSASSVFRDLESNPLWNMVRRRVPILAPYMHSAAVCRAAREAGVDVPDGMWNTVVVDRLTERMNDKAVFYEECMALGLPVPRFWIAEADTVIDSVIELLRDGVTSLYIRQTRSGGAFGNITVEKTHLGYSIRELGAQALSHGEFVQILRHFVQTSFWDEFIVAELLDLYASPGTLFFADDEVVTVICHTYQILSRDRAFIGFLYPIRDEKIKQHFEEVERAVRKLIEPWRKQGYRGYGNVDWMVTLDGKVYFAERNARMTAVVPPLNLVNKLLKHKEAAIIAPRIALITRDAFDVGRPTTFREVKELFQRENLLWEESKGVGGVVITIPPLPRLGLNTIGLMFIGSSLAEAHRIYERTLHIFGVDREEMLFTYEVQ